MTLISASDEAGRDVSDRSRMERSDECGLTNTEVQIAVNEKLQGRPRERVDLNPRRTLKISDCMLMLVSLIM